MATYDVSVDRLLLVLGQAFAMPFTWQDVDGAAIDLTGFTLEGVVVCGAVSQALTMAVTSAPAGTFVASLTAEQTDLLPKAAYSSLRLTLTDTQDQTFNIRYPLNLVRP